MRMENQSARPGVQHAQHTQLGAEPFGIAGQILEGLGAGAEEHIQAVLQMGSDPRAERFGHGEGHQEIGDGQLELRIGSDQLDFGRPGLAESFFPEELDGADGLSGSLASQFLLGFEIEEVPPEFFRGDQVGRFAVKLAEFANASPVAQDGAFGQRQQAQVVEEAI